MRTSDQIRKYIDDYVYHFTTSKMDPYDAALQLSTSIESLLDKDVVAGDLVTRHAHNTNLYGTIFRITVSIEHVDGKSSTWQYLYDPVLAPQHSAGSSKDDDAFDKAMRGI